MKWPDSFEKVYERDAKGVYHTTITAPTGVSRTYIGECPYTVADFALPGKVTGKAMLGASDLARALSQARDKTVTLQVEAGVLWLRCAAEDLSVPIVGDLADSPPIEVARQPLRKFCMEMKTRTLELAYTGAHPVLRWDTGELMIWPVPCPGEKSPKRPEVGELWAISADLMQKAVKFASKEASGSVQLTTCQLSALTETHCAIWGVDYYGPDCAWHADSMPTQRLPSLSVSATTLDSAGARYYPTPHKVRPIEQIDDVDYQPAGYIEDPRGMARLMRGATRVTLSAGKWRAWTPGAEDTRSIAGPEYWQGPATSLDSRLLKKALAAPPPKSRLVCETHTTGHKKRGRLVRFSSPTLPGWRVIVASWEDD